MPGAGLYEVGPGKTYSTIQAALDQLWLDQGSSGFTETQEIRVYTDTYNETIDPHNSLRPTTCCPLRIAAASGNSPTINIGSAAVGVDLSSIEFVELEGLTFSGSTGAGTVVKISYTGLRVRSCIFAGTKGRAIELWASHLVIIEDCQFSGQTSEHIYSGYSNHGSVLFLLRCRFADVRACRYVKAYGHMSVHIESCTGDGVSLLNATSSYAEGLSIVLLHNVVYGAPLVKQTQTTQRFEFARVRNCICQGGEYALQFEGPGPRVFESDYNCFYGQTTAVAKLDGEDKTFPQWQALGYDANSKNVDPKLVNPEEGNFHLQSESPCINAGAGAAVKYDLDDETFSDTVPNMGAYNDHETQLEPPSKPEITAVSLEGSTFTVTVDGDGGVTNIIELVCDDGTVDAHEQRTGDGDVELQAASTGVWRTIWAWSENSAGPSEPALATPARWFVSAASTLDEIKAAIASRLRDDSHLASLLGDPDAVYYERPPQGTVLPCVTYAVEPSPAPGTDAPGKFDIALRLSIFAATTSAAHEILEAADAALLGDGSAIDCSHWKLMRLRRVSCETATTGTFDGGAEVLQIRTTWNLSAYRKQAS